MAWLQLLGLASGIVVIIIGARRVIAQGISIDSMRAVTLMVMPRPAVDRLQISFNAI